MPGGARVAVGGRKDYVTGGGFEPVSVRAHVGKVNHRKQLSGGVRDCGTNWLTCKLRPVIIEVIGGPPGMPAPVRGGVVKPKWESTRRGM